MKLSIKDKMNDTHKLVHFWSSLISEKGLAPHVESIMQIEDIEERGISLMSRVSFLWFMGLKYEKDELEITLQKITSILQKKSSSFCGGCLDIKELVGDALQQKDLEKGEITHQKNSVPAKTSTLEACVEEKENFNFQKPSKIRKVLAPDSECIVKNKINSLTVKSKVIPETNHEELSDENVDFFDSPQSNSPVLGKQSKFNASPKSKANRVLFSRCSPVFKSKELISPPKTLRNSLPNSPSLLEFESLTPEISQSIIPSLDQSSKSPFSRSIEIIDDIKGSKDKLAGQCSSHSSFHASKEVEVYKTSPSQIDKTGNSPKGLDHQKTLQGHVKQANKLKALNALKDSKINIEVSLDTNSKIDHKKYKQTKITKDCFLKKNEGDSVTEGKINWDEKEKDYYSKIIEKSLATKQVQAMMLKKQEELERENPPKVPKNSKSSFSPIEKLFPSTVKLKEKPLTSSKQSCFTEEEILRQMEKESEVARTSKLSLKRKKPLINDSFDVLPTKKNEEKDYAFRGEVVRKKSDRKKLEGWECLECKNYFESRGLSEAERKDVMNKCSRHRSKHTAVTNTPEGFWKVGWSDD